MIIETGQVALSKRDSGSSNAADAAKIPHLDDDQLLLEQENLDLDSTQKTYQLELVWRNIIIMLVLHILTCYGVINVGRLKVQTIFFAWIVALLSTLGVQGGAHRLWTHRAYKATWGLRLFLSLCHVMALQNDLYEWCRDHRVHHKWSETDADPHNSKRGFFFCHMGWLLTRKHPDVIRKGRTVDLSDLEADPIVMFQRRHYIPMVIVFWALLPTFIPVYMWGENALLSFVFVVCLRYTITLHQTWLVNSWAHLYGSRPYDSKIGPVEASIRDMLLGEGFHNFHHTFPWDYSASELGAWDVFNPCTAMIDLFYYLGMAYDLKKVNPALVKQRIYTRGDPAVHYYYPGGSTLKEWARGALSLFFYLYLFLSLHYIFKFIGYM